MDVTNPGLVNVAAETYGNPDPNGGTSRWRPEDDGSAVSAGSQAFPPAENGVESDVFHTPEDVDVEGSGPPSEVSSTPVPDADQVYVDEQSIGQGSMQPVDPGDPSAGSRFVGPADFVVTGPAQSFQTNFTEAVQVQVAVTGVFDADDLPNAADANSTRYYLTVAPANLTSYPVSLLGRQVQFADDTLTASDAGAARRITGYGKNFIVVDRDDPSVSNGDVASLDLPQIGDTLLVDVQRQGSEQVNDRGDAPANVFILPAPPPFVPNSPQDQPFQGNVNASTGPQPGTPYVGSGTDAPAGRNVEVADQSLVVGLPTNVYV